MSFIEVNWERPLMVKDKANTYHAGLSMSTTGREHREIKYLTVELPGGIQILPFKQCGQGVDSELRVINR